MRAIILTLCWLIFGGSLLAQPKHFRAMFRDDPATTMVIGFSTEIPDALTAPTYTLYYSEVDHGTDLAAYAADHSPVEVSREVQAFKLQNHYFFRLSGLMPKTAYYFVVATTSPLSTATGAEISERYWFKTLSDNPNDPISIISGGDSRQDLEHPDQTLESITIRQEANKMVAKIRPDFVAFGGDYTFAGTPTEWRDWLQDWELTISDDNKLTPIVAAAGNHEYAPFGGAQAGSQILVNIFDVPHDDVYFALTFGGNLLRLYTLNTEVAITGEQSEWLRSDLAATNTSVHWKMAQYHKPIRPHEAGKSDLNSAYAEWANSFFDYQMRLVFESDAHVVKNTFPLMPTEADNGEMVEGYEADMNFVRTDNRGTVFVGEGTWAALRDGNDAKAWTQSMGGFNQVKWTWVGKDTVELRTIITYDPNDVDYVNNMEALTEDNRFTEPQGIQLWEPESGKVVYITENGLTERGATTNTLPELELPDVELVLQAGDSILELAEFASDADMDPLSFSLAVLSGSANVGTSLNGSELLLAPQAVGSTMLEVTSTDGVGQAVDTMEVKVISEIANGIPYFLAYTAVLNSTQDTLVVSVAEFASDPDGDQLEVFFAATSAPELIEFFWDASGFTVVRKSGSGVAQLTLGVSDGKDSVQAELGLIVEPLPNTMPVWVEDSIVFSFVEGDPLLQINLQDYVQDPEGDALDFQLLDSGDESIVVPELANGVLELVEYGGAHGVSAIEVAVSDGEFVVAKSIFVEVQAGVGLTEKQTWGWNIFPNPFGKDAFYVSSKTGVQDFKVQVYGLNGALLKSKSTQTGTVALKPEQNWPAVVIVSVVDAHGLEARKVILKGY